jgi:hypothetical protein
MGMTQGGFVEDSVSVFISYSHKDEVFRKELHGHLAALRGEGRVSEWHDHLIEGGQEWDGAIKRQMEKADIILLLLSADFIDSDYVRDNEIPAAIARHERGEAVVIPVFLRRFDYSRDAPYAKLQGYPEGARPVDEWEKRDQAYYTVVQGIRSVVDRILEDRERKAKDLQQALLRYRTKAKELLADGVIDIAERDTLNELRETLKLSETDAEQIEREESEPHRKKDEAKEKYRKTLQKYAEAEYPFSDKTRESLDLRMRDLGLNADDVKRVEDEIRAQAEAQRNERREIGKQQATDELAKAEAALAQKQFPAAQEHVAAARKVDPEHPEVTEWDKKISDAAAQARRDADAALVKAESALPQKQFAAARKHVAAARAADPERPDLSGWDKKISDAAAQARSEADAAQVRAEVAPTPEPAPLDTAGVSSVRGGVQKPVKDIDSPSSSKPTKKSEVGAFRYYLLLFRPNRWVGWVVRIVFFIFLLLAVASLLGGAISAAVTTLLIAVLVRFANKLD